MKTMKFTAFALIIVIVLSFTLANTVSQDSVIGGGTRQGTVGWQHADFADNVEVDFSPINPKPSEPIIINIRSIEPDVAIQIAYLQIEILFPQGSMATGGSTFQRISETEMRTTIGPYDYNGTAVTFWINALDYNNVPMLSPNYVVTVVGEERTGGWAHNTFEGNIELTQTPAAPNATEPVMITIESKEGVPIEGANLYFIYTPAGGVPESGGWAFDRLNFTAMEKEIPGNFHPAGANISYWVVVWDEYSELTKSEPYNYTIPGIVEFNYPFEYTVEDENGDVDKSEWHPDSVILLSMVGIAMLVVPLFAYLYTEEKKRLEKKQDLLLKEEDKKALISGSIKKAEEKEKEGEK